MSTQTKNSESAVSKDHRFTSFSEFYPYYLSEHRNSTCRSLHYIGSSIGLGVLLFSLTSGNFQYIPMALVAGYAFAWIGHFFFEHNKPATFRYPLWSFMGDWVMLKDFLLGRIDKKTTSLLTETIDCSPMWRR